MKKYADYVIKKINEMSDKEFEKLLKDSGIEDCPYIKENS